MFPVIGPESRKFLDLVEANVPADLDIHIVMDNYGTHKTKAIRRLDVAANGRAWQAHFTSAPAPPGGTRSSAGSWFADRKQISLS